MNFGNQARPGGVDTLNAYDKKETAMNWDQIKGNWNETKGKLRQQYGDLTDDELEQAKGSQEELVGLIQQKYGKSKEEAERELDSMTA